MYSLNYWKMVQLQVRIQFCCYAVFFVLFAHRRTLLRPVYRVEKPRPFISPSYLIWAYLRQIYGIFLKFCNFG